MAVGPTKNVIEVIEISFLRREGPIGLMAVVMIALIATYYFDIPGGSGITSFLQQSGNIVAAAALGLGFINLLIIHGKRIMNQGKDWIFSVWLLLIMIAYYIVGLMPPLAGSPTFKWVFDNAYGPLSSTMYSMVTFFITSAAFRAFRARNVEAGILLITGTFVMLTNAPLGEAIWPGFGTIGRWFLDVPTTAGMRVLLISSVLGAVALGIRAMLGRESRILGETGEI